MEFEAGYEFVELAGGEDEALGGLVSGCFNITLIQLLVLFILHDISKVLKSEMLLSQLFLTTLGINSYEFDAASLKLGLVEVAFVLVLNGYH